MNTNSTRNQIAQKLDQLSPEVVKLVAEFIEFLTLRQKQGKDFLSSLENLSEEEISSRNRNSHPNRKDPNIRYGKGSLLDIKETWVGDDFDECLQSVYDTRSQIKA